MNDLSQLIGSSVFSDLDCHLAGSIEAPAGGEFPLLALPAAFSSRTRTQGHICLDLQALAESPFPEKPVDQLKPERLPGLATWVKELKSSPVVGSLGQFSPLVIDTQHRLYLHRYWEYEQTLAAEILKRSQVAWDEAIDQALGQKLKVHFSADSAGSVNSPPVAAFAAARGKFCVISGGPGTCKTHTLVLIKALLLDLDPTRKLRIAVTAPAGRQQPEFKSPKCKHIKCMRTIESPKMIPKHLQNQLFTEAILQLGCRNGLQPPRLEPPNFQLSRRTSAAK